MARRQLSPESKRRNPIKTALSALSSVALLATSLVGLSLVADVVAAPPAAATFAEGGEGRFIGAIDWFDFGEADVPIDDGETMVNSRAIGDHVLETTCTISNIDGEIQTYRSGTWRGDGFDNLYNIGGADDPMDPLDESPNTLVTGIANTQNAATVAFDFDCGVTFDGAPADIGGLVFADAEESNLRQGEYIAATTEEDVTWRVIDRFRRCDTSVMAWLQNDRLQLGPNADQCADINNSAGPLAVGFMQGATGARVDMHGGGKSAVSIGVVVTADFGDAPVSYGEAGALVEPAWEGGVITPNTLDTQTDVSDDSFELGSPTLPALGLGETIDSDADYQASDDAMGDDEMEAADEDAVDGPIVYDTEWGETVTQEVSCRGDGYVTGWVDWNANGTFDDGEASQTQQCADGAVTLSWVVPDDAVDQLEDAPSFLRLRIADNETDSATATDIVDSGEVEDHAIVVDVPNPGLTLSKTADTEGPLVRGDTVEYTITVTNSGEIDYTEENPAVITDDMTGVSDDATYNDDAEATSGTVDDSGMPANITWSGPLAVGESATITYTVTVNQDTEDGATLDNFVTGPPESNCLDGTEDGCNVHIPVSVDPGLQIIKSADATEVDGGDTVAYTITVENTGNTTYTADAPAAIADDMTGVIDDAAYNDDASVDVGTVDYAAPILSWSSGEDDFAPGDMATITYTVTVNDDVAAGETLDNVVTGPPESNCLDGTEEGCGIHIPSISRPGLEIEKTADAEQALPGDTVTYTVTVENTGNTTYDADAPASFTDDLSEVIDDATYNDDASADIGAADYADPVLTWTSGDDAFAPGDVATITYTVTVNDPDAGDGSLQNTVVGPPESNCLDADDPAEECGIVIPVRQLEISKTAQPDDELAPGATVTYTVTVTNTGQVPYTDANPATFTDDLTEVLDDATYNADAIADVGEVTYSAPVLTWSGALAPGTTATVIYTVTVDDPDEGDGSLQNAVVGPPESNCDDGTEDGCNIVVPVRQLQIEKTSDATTASPGDTVEYTVTVTNTGQVPYGPAHLASFDDDLTAVLDDATYNGDAAASAGTVSYEAPVLSWEGALAPGASVTVTYSVTVNDPDAGDGSLENVVVGPPESNCLDTDDPAEECGVVIPVRGLTIEKTSDATAASPGDTVEYTVTVTNTGQVPYTEANPATFTDDLTAVLDDARYNGDASASAGEVSYEAPVLSWEGALAPGATATVTYSVTVNDPDTGDGSLENVVVGPPESNCLDTDDSADECGIVIPVRGLVIEKTSDATEAAPGDTVTYTVEVTNTGQVPYTEANPATFTDDLTAVLDDATYNGDASASAGAVSYEAPVLSWSGALAPGETATVTYTVTVHDPDEGDASLQNAVVGPPESNCDDGTENGCHIIIPVRQLQIVKSVDSAGQVDAGDTVTYTVTVTNTGTAPYTDARPASFTDDLTEVLDDATYNGDAAADVGEVTYTEPVLSWSGALAPGNAATITYSVAVNNPLTGDGELVNAVVGPDESNCDPDSGDPECSTDVPVRALFLQKSSDGSEGARPGDVVTYTVTATNVGQVDYTDADPATFDDDLTEVLDDAAYNGDGSADTGEVSYAEPVLSWAGALAVGEQATITYTVTVNDPATGDGNLFNVVVGPDESNCTDANSTDPNCIEPDPLRMLNIVKSADPTGPVTVGDTVTYTVEVTNTGTADYTADDPAFFTDVMEGVLDDATYNDDVSADLGEASFDDGTLSWSGALASGQTATVTYSVTVNDPMTGDGTMANAVLGPDEANCPAEVPADGAAMPVECQIVTPIRAFQVEKSVDKTEAEEGDVVTYTVTVTSLGTAPYTDAVPAGFSDDLTEVLDDAAYNGDATATAGDVSYSEPALTWSGPLALDQTVTVTYSVTIDEPDAGDRTLVNVVSPSTGSGGHCTTDDACTTRTTVPGILPLTGGGASGALIAIALLLLAGGGVAFGVSARRRRV